MTTETTDIGSKAGDGQAASGSGGVFDPPSWEERLAAAREQRQQVLEERRQSGDLGTDAPAIVGPKPWEAIEDADSFDLIKHYPPEPEEEFEEEIDDDEVATAVMPLSAAVAATAGREKMIEKEAAEEESQPGHLRAVAFIGIGTVVGFAVALASTTLLPEPNAGSDARRGASVIGGGVQDVGSASDVASADIGAINTGDIIGPVTVRATRGPIVNREPAAPVETALSDSGKDIEPVATLDIDQPSFDPQTIDSLEPSVTENIITVAIQTTNSISPEAIEALPSIDVLPVSRPFLVAGNTSNGNRPSLVDLMADAPVMTPPVPLLPLETGLSASSDVTIAGEHQSGLLAPGATEETAAVIQSVGKTPSVANLLAGMAQPAFDNLPVFADQLASRSVEFVGPAAITANLSNEAEVAVDLWRPENPLTAVSLDVSTLPTEPMQSYAELGPLTRDPLVASWAMTIDLPEISETVAPNALEAPAARPILWGDLSRYQVRVHVPSAVAEEAFLSHVEALQIGGLKPDTARVNFKISQDNVRFFHPEDAPMANAVAERLGALARDFTDFSPKPPLGTVEVWIAGTSAVAAAPKTVKRTTRTTTRRRVSPEEALRQRIARRLRRGEHL